jgi:hypothetical protein
LQSCFLETMDPAARQQELKRELRTALLNDDAAGCWCRIAMMKGEALVRLVCVKGEHYSFVAAEKGFDLKQCFYLLHETEFCVCWVRSGPNCCGCALDGDELESSWFVHPDSDTD